MLRPRALDLFCRAGGVSEGLLRAGFDVVAVDILDCSKAFNRGPGADALTFPAERALEEIRHRAREAAKP